MAERSGELENNNFENQTGDALATETKDQFASTANEISDDPDEIRGQIEDTRRGMSETLDAIQEKLSIANISEQVKEQVTEQITGAVETLKTTVSDATIGKAGKIMKNIGQEVKKMNIGKIASENPFPLVLIGLGVGLLVFKGYRKSSSNDYRKYRYRGNHQTAGTQDSQPGAISRKVGELSQTVSDSANKAYESVSGTAGDAYDKIGDVGGQLRKQYKHYLEENPLVVGAVALALGAAVGLAVPSTRYEGELMGEASENLMSKAETAARGAFDKVQEVVGQAKETIVEDAKQVVNQAQNSITENLKTENLEQEAKA